MAIMETTISRHITNTPGVCGGKPCIAGTRIRVEDIYVWHVLQGQSPEEIVAGFPQLTLADVYAAMAYYYDHREELEREWAEGDAFIEEMKRREPSRLRERMKELGIDPDSLPSR
jgi:uncharacterized protein (DUF433 family)